MNVCSICHVELSSFNYFLSKKYFIIKKTYDNLFQKIVFIIDVHNVNLIYKEIFFYFHSSEQRRTEETFKKSLYDIVW